MKINNNDKLNNILSKIKNIKNIKIIIGLIITATLILTYGFFNNKLNTKKNNNENISSSTTLTYNYTAEYTEEEKKLADILSNINGIGETKVMITFDTKDNIKGVIVVAKGADNPLAEIQIRHAIITSLKIDYNSIEVFSMK